MRQWKLRTFYYQEFYFKSNALLYCRNHSNLDQLRPRHFKESRSSTVATVHAYYATYVRYSNLTAGLYCERMLIVQKVLYTLS